MISLFTNHRVICASLGTFFHPSPCEICYWQQNCLRPVTFTFSVTDLANHFLFWKGQQIRRIIPNPEQFSLNVIKLITWLTLTVSPRHQLLYSLFCFAQTFDFLCLQSMWSHKKIIVNFKAARVENQNKTWATYTFHANKNDPVTDCLYTSAIFYTFRVQNAGEELDWLEAETCSCKRTTE